jgi:hypothetical protein
MSIYETGIVGTFTTDKQCLSQARDLCCPKYILLFSLSDVTPSYYATSFY